MDVIKCLKPIFVVLQVFGILPCSIQKTGNLYVIVKSENHIKYSKILLATFVIVDLICIPFYFIFTKSRLFLHGSSKILIVLGVFIFHISITLLLSLVLKNIKSIEFWINKMNVICAYRLPLSKTKVLVRVLTFLLISALVNIFVVCSTGAFHYVEVNRSRFEQVEQCITFFGVVLFNLFTKLFLMFVLFIRLYYKHLNETIVNSKWGNLENKHLLTVIKGLILEDMFIKDLLDFLHRLFIPPITLYLVWFFDFMLYNILCTGREDIWFVFQIVWAFYICWEAFSIVIICQMTINEAGRTSYCLHQLCIENVDASLKEEVEIFSLQIHHQKVEFSGCGFFKIDCPLLHSAVGAIMTYIVILVELQIKSESSSVCYCNGTDINV